MISKSSSFGFGSLKRGFCCATAFALSGCFGFTPRPLDSVSPGESVRILVTDEALRGREEAGAMLFQEHSEEGGAPLLRGTLVRRDESSVAIHVPMAVRQEGFFRRSLQQQITIPRGAVISVESRELDRFRTGAAVLGGAVAVGLVVRWILSGAVNDTQRPPTYPSDARIPIRVPPQNH